MKIFSDIFSNDKHIVVSGLTDELKSIYISQKFAEEKESILVICNSLFEANKMYNFLKNYISDILFFPMDDFITSEILAVSPDLKMTRLETINDLKDKKKKIVITNLMGNLRFLPNPDLFYKNYVELKKDNDYNIHEIVTKLYDIGYEKQTIINKSGEIAVRGYVIDIFPINYSNPIRIEFWGDTITSLRFFDINTQLTIDELDQIEIMCNTEFIVNANIDTRNLKQSDLKEYGEVYSIKNYMDNLKIIYIDYNDLKLSYDNLIDEIKEYCISNDISLKKEFMNEFDWEESLKYIDLCKFNSNNEKGIDYNSYIIEEKISNLNDLKDIYLKKYKTVIICVSNKYQVNKIEDILGEDIVYTDEENILDGEINVIVKKISEGFIFKNYFVVGEQEIFNTKNIYKSYKSNFKYGSKIKDITKLNVGDYIVHNEYGVGKYCGIKTLTKNNLKKDYLQILYKDNDSLYIPVEKIELISKYSSNDGYVPKINKLGTTEWQKTKIRVRKKASDIASELINLYALREMKEGFPFEKDDEDQINFEKEFPYTPTESQIKAIDEIKEDMESPHPMDRLLCGDVGFGKTELAFRAAFKAILSGKQVAFLCPTTILSNQHYQNAIERFKLFPVKIELLNRFVTIKKTNEILKNLKEGKVDFVIGTHKLLNEKIEYKNLGLLIVDEEQRFGVLHKEKMKKYRNNIDVLTLSATPIPRTLQMSLSGVRSLSLLEIPPSNRYPVQTYVLSYNEKLIKDAIYKELSRSGQVFLLYNKVSDIESKSKEIQKLVKEAKVVFAHGRMPKTQLEEIMLKFINKEFDVLVCTTIIETGIDIPNVNTLIVMDADKFGLSQLYQLRGRVGRTNKIAYCYLMYDQKKILSEIATKRLNAIKEFTELGSGMSIAMRDLSLRGAGDIIGNEQAGFIDTIGIELFTKILKEEIDKLKGFIVEEQEDSQPLLNVNTCVEDKYVDEETLKIEIHRMINEINSYKKLIEIKSNIEDRFGKVSEDLVIYMYEQWFESLSKKLDVKKVKQMGNQIEIIFGKEITKKIDGDKLFMNAFDIHSKFVFGMNFGCLSIKLNTKDLEKHFIYYLVSLLELIEKTI